MDTHALGGSSNPPPPAPAGGDTTPGDRLRLAAGLAVGTAGALLPATAVAWFVSALAAELISAEVLEHTGGLVPATFGGGFWTSACVNGAVLLWCLVRWFRRRRRPEGAPWRPLTALVGVYVVLGAVLLPLDLAGAWDAPDVVTTSIVLGANALWHLVTPVVILALLVRGLALLWRHGAASRARARSVAALVAGLGLGGGALIGATLHGAAIGYQVVEGLPADVGASGGQYVDEAHATFVAISGALESPRVSAPSVEEDVDDEFARCAEALAAAREDGSPALARAAAHLVRRGLSWHDAEDVAMATLIKVCKRHARRALEDPVSYFLRAVRNERKTWRVRQRRESWRRLRWGELGRIAPVDPEPDPEDLKRLERALARLRAADREVLRLRYFDGLSHGEIGEALDLTESAARKRVSRAMANLRRAWHAVGP